MEHQYKTVVAKTFEEIEAIRPAWTDWQYHPNADIDHFMTVIKARGQIICPYVTMLYEDNRLKALVAGRIEDVKLKVSLGYKTIFEPTLRHLTIIYGGILGDTSSAVAKEIMKSLQKCLSDKEAEIIYFANLNVESEFFSIGRTYAPFILRDHGIQSNPHWSIQLPATYEEFFSRLSRRTRSSFNNYANRLEKTFKDKLDIRSYKQITDLDRIMSEMEHIAKRTYHRGLGVGFVDNEENKVRIELGLNNHWFHVYVLYIEAEPVAFWSGWKYKQSLYTDFTGYLPEFGNLRVGNYLLLKMIKDMLSDPSVKSIDFGFGDAQYKQILSNRKWEEASIYIFSPSIKNISVNLSRTFAFCLAKLINAALAKTDIRDKIKKIWRKHVSTQE